jgi:hypothetical protein
MPRGAVKAPVLAKNAASPSAHSASMSLMVPLLVAAAALCAVAIFFVYTFMRSKHAKSGKKKPPVDLDAVPETPSLASVLNAHAESSPIIVHADLTFVEAAAQGCKDPESVFGVDSCDCTVSFQDLDDLDLVDGALLGTLAAALEANLATAAAALGRKRLQTAIEMSPSPRSCDELMAVDSECLAPADLNALAAALEANLTAASAALGRKLAPAPKEMSFEEPKASSAMESPSPPPARDAGVAPVADAEADAAPSKPKPLLRSPSSLSPAAKRGGLTLLAAGTAILFTVAARRGR